MNTTSYNYDVLLLTIIMTTLPSPKSHNACFHVVSSFNMRNIFSSTSNTYWIELKEKFERHYSVIFWQPTEEACPIDYSIKFKYSIYYGLIWLGHVKHQKMVHMAWQHIAIKFTWSRKSKVWISTNSNKLFFRDSQTYFNY